MNKLQIKSLIKKEKVEVNILPRRSHYLVMFKCESGKKHLYTAFFTKNPVRFTNLDQVNTFLKKLNINCYQLAQNCPHTEMMASSDHMGLNATRSTKEYIQVRI